MRVANIEHAGNRKVAVARGGAQFVDLTRALALGKLNGGYVANVPPTSIQQLLEAQLFDWELFHSVLDYVLEHRIAECLLPPGEFRFLSPFSRPGQIIALARNYKAHAEESVLPPPREPIFFSKSNTSTIGPDDAIILPPNLGRIEPELELAVVIKKEAWHVSATHAQEFIAGYTILNDVSAQELQAREIREGYPLFRCKSLRTFTPIGPCVLTVDEVGIDPALEMVLRVNGETRVRTNSSGLTFGIAQLLEYISGYLLLCPGDIITTGCPKAAGAICPGDVVSLEIERIGILSNPVVAGKDACP